MDARFGPAAILRDACKSTLLRMRSEILSLMKIYLAGPDVFLPDAVEIGRRKAEICARHGLIGIYPLDNAIDLTNRDASLNIYRGNEAMMIEASAIVANLTPFRGASAMPAPSTNSAIWRDAENSASVIATIRRATPTACAKSPQ